MNITALYERAVTLPMDTVPSADHASHTMGSRVDSYVAQRVPARLIDELARHGGQLEIHAIFPPHVPFMLPGAEFIDSGHVFGPDKRYNVMRPLFVRLSGDGGHAHRGTRIMMVVPPGSDYLLHNASLVAHYLRSKGHPRDVLRGVVHYPDAEAAIADWTGLADFVAPGDRLLLGYVREFTDRFIAAGAVEIKTARNEHYGSSLLELPGGQRVRTLGVEYSFWGCISGRLATACQRLGADEIVYAGKLGTLASPEDIYHRVFVPSGYLRYGHAAPLSAPNAPVNGVLARFPELDTGVHLSVATVLEEDIDQRAYADGFGAESIDNEISQMAYALVADPGPHRAAFSAVHFATDYLRRPGEREQRGRFDLTNHRTKQALRGKVTMLDRIAGLLMDYFTDDSDPGVLTGGLDANTARN